jgi:hypothetical protein
MEYVYRFGKTHHIDRTLGIATIALFHFDDGSPPKPLSVFAMAAWRLPACARNNAECPTVSNRTLPGVRLVASCAPFFCSASHYC